jgi:Lrp/AsnC family transcriptional regulator, leucine-responsive regulatory protein
MTVIAPSFRHRTDKSPKAGRTVRSIALDEIDRVILSELIRNGRATYTQLGELAGLSPHAVGPRVRRLVEAGVVTGFIATVDFGAIGRGLEALIDIRLTSTADPDRFEDAVAAIPSVRELAFLTGRFDYQVRASCIDADDLDGTVRALRRGGAAVTETRIILRSRPFRRAVADEPQAAR